MKKLIILLVMIIQTLNIKSECPKFYDVYYLSTITLHTGYVIDSRDRYIMISDERVEFDYDRNGTDVYNVKEVSKLPGGYELYYLDPICGNYKILIIDKSNNELKFITLDDHTDTFRYKSNNKLELKKYVK